MRYTSMLVLAVVLAAATQPAPADAQARMDLIKVLVATPAVERQDYRPVAEVVAGSLIRELIREGGMEVLPRETADQWLGETGRTTGIIDRETAIEAGESLDADIVIYSYISKRYDEFVYRIVLFEVSRDLVQRTLDGTFRITASANEIGRLMKTETPKLVRYIPKRAEIIDPGFAIRQNTIDPERLPPYAELTGLPELDTFGYIEQVFSYFDAYPGETEYLRFNQQDQIQRMVRANEEMDEQMRSQINQYYMIGDFAIRHGLQAFLIENCSYRVINVLLANHIPVFIKGGVLVGYDGLSLDGFSVLKTIDDNYVQSFDLTHRDRMAVLIIVAKPGRYHGVSKDYLEMAVGLYPDEWGETPRMIEIKESILDIEPAGWE